MGSSMSSGFNQLDEHIRQGVEQMEPVRFRWLVLYLAVWVVALFGAAATFIAFTTAKETPEIGWITAGVSGVSLLITRARSSSRCSTLHSAFDVWRETGVQLLEGTARYSAGRGLPQSDFDNSGLNSAFYNRYAASHFLTVGGIRSSALSAQYEYTETYYETEYYTDSDGRSHSREVQKQRTVVVPIFDGMLLILPAELPHSAWVILRHRDAGVPNGVHRLTVASPFLVKHYAVGASDQLAGHRTLTPTLREALWEYRQQFKYTPGYSYRDGLLYITIPHYWLDCGQRPGKWVPMTTARLDRVLKSCGKAIEFLKATTVKLVPT